MNAGLPVIIMLMMLPLRLMLMHACANWDVMIMSGQLYYQAAGVSV